MIILTKFLECSRSGEFLLWSNIFDKKDKINHMDRVQLTSGGKT